MSNRMVPRLIGFLSEAELEFFDLFCTVGQDRRQEGAQGPGPPGQGDRRRHPAGGREVAHDAARRRRRRRPSDDRGHAPPQGDAVRPDARTRRRCRRATRPRPRVRSWRRAGGRLQRPDARGPQLRSMPATGSTRRSPAGRAYPTVEEVLMAIYSQAAEVEHDDHLDPRSTKFGSNSSAEAGDDLGMPVEELVRRVHRRLPGARAPVRAGLRIRPEEECGACTVAWRDALPYRSRRPRLDPSRQQVIRTAEEVT